MTVELEKAPEYAAISYTWGAPLPAKTVKIDGCPFAVRGNTVYALWQAKQCGKYECYWLDAVCINQDDLDEKSAQVELMGDIYSRAAKVVVSLGDHFDDSELVLSTARALDVSSWCARTGVSGSQRLRLKAGWFAATGLDAEGQRRLEVAWKGFCSRPYWRRAWIVQELMLARRWSVDFMVGRDAIDWFKIYQLYDDITIDMMRGEEMHTFPFTKILMIRDRLDLGLPRVVDALQFASDAECFDPRDRVYSFLRLCYWPDHLPSLVPDYTRGRFNLALEVVRYLDRCFQCFGQVEILLQALRIDARTPEVIDLLAERQLRSNSPPGNVSLGSCKSLDQDPGSKVRAFQHKNNCCRITECDSNKGKFTTTLMKQQKFSRKDPVDLSISLEEHIDPKTKGSSGPSALYRKEVQPKLLVVGSQTVGLLPPSVRPGDILAQIQRRDNSSISRCAYLVLRELHSDGLCEIVGQAVLDIPYHPCNGDKIDFYKCLDEDVQPHVHPKVERGFQFFFDPLDILLWTVQDRLLQTDVLAERQLLLQRWHTAVTTSKFSSYALSTDQEILREIDIAEGSQLEERGLAAMQDMEDQYYRLYGDSSQPESA